MKEGNIQSGSQSSTASTNEYATIKFVGNVGVTPNGRRFGFETVSTPIKLASLLTSLQEKYGLDLRRDSTLIMINGVEARAIEDLETVILAGDQVVMVPMFHGG